MWFITPLLLLLCLGLFNPSRAANPAHSPKDLEKIDRIVVIYLENHSFDNLYGFFPGAEGLGAAKTSHVRQSDRNGKTHIKLPPVMDTRAKPPSADPRFPDGLPNAPFPIDRYVSPDQRTGDLMHRFYQHQVQINHGRMDRFAAESDAAGLVMGYYDGSRLGLWQYAQRYTLADHFFQAAFGGSYLNHLWLICACTPRYENSPAQLRAVVDPAGRLQQDGVVTPDGYAVNSIFPYAKPYPSSVTDPAARLPPQTLPTIGDRLSDKGISWKWYAGGWNDAVAGKADASFQFHHQPFIYFARYGEGTEERRLHLQDEADLLEDIRLDRLPSVAFYKPLGRDNQHPSYTDVQTGDRHIVELLGKIERTAHWPSTVIIVTYDEFGGFFDHVPPPQGDRWGPGSRVPAIIISPLAKRGYVDHRIYDTTSILKLIEDRFGLKPLGTRDAKAGDLRNSLKLNLH